MKRTFADIRDHLEAQKRESQGLKDRDAAERSLRNCAELEVLLEEAEGRGRDREALLREVTLVLSCTSTPRVLDLIMDSVLRLSGAERGFLVLSGADGEAEVTTARNMERRPVTSAASKVSRRIIESVMRSNRSVRLDDALNTPPFSLAESVTRLKLLSVLCVPISVGDRLLGALYLENRHATGVFSAETESLICEFTGRIGAAVLNAESRNDLEVAQDALQGWLAGTDDFEGMVGTDTTFRDMLNTIQVVARSDIPVLIEGESGTGKELLARAVHRGSSRREAPFISVNCAALPHALLESELFGHTRGAFTGAVRERRGLFAAAEKGTLFLDEIGELPLQLQAKLLRVLQSGEYRAVGSDASLCADVRVVAATQRTVSDEVEAGRFREDLFFRLNGVLLQVPALRERKGDIPLFVEHFLKEFSGDGQRLVLDKDAYACLMLYRYPGNVRELQTIIRRAVLFARDGAIGVDALPEHVAGSEGAVVRLPLQIPTTAEELRHAKEGARKAAVREIELKFLHRALAQANGRPGEAARLVGMNRSQFARMLSQHGLADARRARRRKNA